MFTESLQAASQRREHLEHQLSDLVELHELEMNNIRQVSQSLVSQSVVSQSRRALCWLMSLILSVPFLLPLSSIHFVHCSQFTVFCLCIICSFYCHNFTRTFKMFH